MDELGSEFQGATIELISNPTDFYDRIDVVKYDNEGNREVLAEAKVNGIGEVEVIKAVADRETLVRVLQEMFDEFSARQSNKLSIEKKGWRG